VLAAGRDGTVARAALESLCAAYWSPVYGYIRRWGHDADSARDLTQAFFLSLLERGDFGRVSRERGRFRSFLLGAAQHFLSNERARSRTAKRGGGFTIEALEFDAAEQRYRREPIDRRTPETIFTRRWAVLLLERALADVRDEFLEHGTSEEFERLKPVLTGEGTDTGYRTLASDLGKSEGALKVAIHRLRRKFQQRVRDRIAETVTDSNDIEEELAYLVDALNH